MNLAPLLLITALYLLIAFIKPYLQKRIPFNICSICLAVSISWLALLPSFFLGKTEPETLAILMGMSVTGLMYKTETIFKDHQIKNFWLTRILIIVGGFYLIHSLLNNNWNLFVFLLVLLPIIISINILFFQTEKGNKDSKSIKKRLEDCC